MENNKYKISKAYSGYFLNNDKLLSSSSGGAVSALSEAIINRDGVVFGAAYSKDFKKVEYKCVTSINDLNSLKGSKYCETTKEVDDNGDRRSIFSILEEKINKNKLILFVGLGCDIAAAKSFCEIKKLSLEKVFFAEILCHGPTTAEVHRQFIERLEKKYNSQIISFNVRHKKFGWTPPYLRAEFKNGDVFEREFYKTDYGFAFNFFSKPGCYNCHFRGENHQGDIVFGDYWGITESMNGWNKNGVSIMFIRTNKGDELIKLIDKSSFSINDADISLALENNPMFYTVRNKPPYYDKFNYYLSKKGLHYCVKNYPFTSIGKIKRFIKKLLRRN